MSDLLIDIGNSALKWALDNNGDIGPLTSCLHHKTLCAELGDAWRAIDKPDQVLVSNVAGAQVQQRLVETLQNLWSISPQFANTRQNAFGVRIAYQQPQRLGVDRWLVLIAAHRLRLGPVLVVDCGTAVTLDALAADGTHWGGLIIPGLRMVWESLFSNTRIAPIERDESTDVLGKNTNECITSGALQAVTGMIEKTRQDLHRRYGLDARILLTGSDAPRIAERLNGSFEHRPLLILEGLQLLKDAT